MPTPENSVHIIDETHYRIGNLIKKRIPWLVIGLLGGILASFVISKYEAILSANISLAFFLPLIVYMSDAVGTQTETIFVRNISRKHVNFYKYLGKEIILGTVLGIIFGLCVAIASYLWIQSIEIAVTVGLAMLINVAIAPILAIVIPELLLKEHSDPALGAGPFTTVIQDIISILIYFIIATVIIL